MSIEKEAKFLLRSLPACVYNITPRLIEQHYVPLEEAGIYIRLNNAFEGTLIVDANDIPCGIVEARVCSIDNNWYIFTMKSDGTLQRTEYEMNIDKYHYDIFAMRSLGYVRKYRYKIRCDDLVVEIDQYLDRDLVVAEVEFTTQDVSYVKEVVDKLVGYSVQDITHLNQYKNRNLSLRV